LILSGSNIPGKSKMNELFVNFGFRGLRIHVDVHDWFPLAPTGNASISSLLGTKTKFLWSYIRLHPLKPFSVVDFPIPCVPIGIIIFMSIYFRYSSSLILLIDLNLLIYYSFVFLISLQLLLI